MSERRFTEEEMAAIFERAVRLQHSGGHAPARTDGMTLAELEEIGREAGIAPERVREAAKSLQLGAREESQGLLGFTIGVGRTVELGRRLSDEEWERLVVDLRETFDARGRVSSQGSLKQWTNGNLQALLEPSGEGHRLRLRTMNSFSRAMMTLGATFFGVSATITVISLLSGSGGGDGLGLIIAGLGMFAVGAARLPSWARTRKRQMAEVAERLMTDGQTDRRTD